MLGYVYLNFKRIFLNMEIWQTLFLHQMPQFQVYFETQSTETIKHSVQQVRLGLLSGDFTSKLLFVLHLLEA